MAARDAAQKKAAAQVAASFGEKTPDKQILFGVHTGPGTVGAMYAPAR